MRTFFSQVTPQHKEHIPAHGPVIFAANHPNTMMDPLVIVNTCGRKLHFFAKSTLFNRPFNRWFLNSLQLVPLHRQQDNPAEMVKNVDAFSKGYQILKDGSAFLIFPEGISTGDRILSKIKTGAARICFGAEKGNNWELGTTIIPVGLSYSNAVKFRSDVIVRFGQPIRVADYRHAYEADEFEAVHQLTSQIETALSKLTINLKDLAVAEIVSALETIYKKELMLDLGMDMENKSDEFSATKGLVYAVEWYFENRPDKVEELSAMLKRYLHHLDRLKLKDEYLDPAGESASTWDRAKVLLYIVVGFPLYLYGLVNNVVPYKFPRWFAKHFARAKAEIAPTKLMAGTGIFLIYYPLEIALVSYLTESVPWTILYTLTLVPSGNFVLDYSHRFRDYRQHLRFLSIFYKKRELMYKLIEQRQTLIQYIDETKDAYMKIVGLDTPSGD